MVTPVSEPNGRVRLLEIDMRDTTEYYGPPCQSMDGPHYHTYDVMVIILIPILKDVPPLRAD
jgi:hypothetical protein